MLIRNNGLNGLGAVTSSILARRRAIAAINMAAAQKAAAKKATDAAAAKKALADAAAAKAAAEEAAAPAIAVAYLKQQVSDKKPLNAEQLTNVTAALQQLPLPRIVDLIAVQQRLAPAGTPPDQLGSWFTSIRDTVESVVAAPVTIFAPNSLLAKTVSQGAQAKAITMVKLRDATEAVASVVADYWVPGISVVLSKYVVSKGGADLLNSKIGKVAQFAVSAAGAYDLITTHAAQLANAQKSLVSAAKDAAAMTKEAQSGMALAQKGAAVVAAITKKPSAPATPAAAPQNPVPVQQKSASALFLPIGALLTLLNFL